jgi:hypothetical protein
MKKTILVCSVVALGLMMVYVGPIHAKADKKPSTVKDVKSLSEGEQVKLALSGAPPHLVKEVGVMINEEKHQWVHLHSHGDEPAGPGPHVHGCCRSPMDDGSHG